MAAETVPTAEMSALLSIASISEHCAFMAAALPTTEQSLTYLGQQMIEIMNVAREGANLPARDWDTKEATDHDR